MTVELPPLSPHSDRVREVRRRPDSIRHGDESADLGLSLQGRAERRETTMHADSLIQRPLDESIGPSQSGAEVSDLPPLLTVDQVVALTQLGRSTIYEAVRRGDIPSVRIGRRVLVPTERLLQRLNIT